MNTSENLTASNMTSTPSPTPPHIALLATKAAEEISTYIVIGPNHTTEEGREVLIGTVTRAITRALLEVAADTKRLDWLERFCIQTSFHISTDEYICQRHGQVSGNIGHAPKLRAAIDAAMPPASLPAAPDAGKGK